MMRSFLAAALLVAAVVQTADAAPKWEDAKAELDATVMNIAMTGSPAAVSSHAAALERALAEGPAAVTAAQSGDGPFTVFVEGPADKDAVVAAAGSAHPGRTVVIASNPYPRISFFLGSFYKQTGRLDDAQRVYGLGIALDGLDGVYGRTSRDLIEQRAGILLQLKRYPEALATYEQGAALPGIPNYLRAAMLRGRGAVLVEMGRLEEAEAAYRASLAVMPGNPIATSGLERVLKLRAGDPAGSPTVQPNGK